MDSVLVLGSDITKITRIRRPTVAAEAEAEAVEQPVIQCRNEWPRETIFSRSNRRVDVDKCHCESFVQFFQQFVPRWELFAA